MAQTARATYVNLSTEEQPAGDASGGATISHGQVQRRFEGEIAGDSDAAVIIARGTPERLGYVATDRFTGRIGALTGSFVFQHGGTIDRGALTPFGYVVPGSGTGELSGLRGTVHIEFIPPAIHELTLTYDFER
jgi:hypothetical protein